MFELDLRGDQEKEGVLEKAHESAFRAQRGAFKEQSLKRRRSHTLYLYGLLMSMETLLDGHFFLIQVVSIQEADLRETSGPVTERLQEDH